MLLGSVDGDVNSHGGGNLHASQFDVLINNKPTIVLGDSASPDSKCPKDGGNHCNPKASTASSDVFVHNIPAHRQSDLRSCGANTIVIGQSNVFIN